MTALGVAMTVAILMAVLGLNAGLKSAFAAQGDPLHILILRKGGTSELTSVFTPAQLQVVSATPGIAKGSDGQPSISMEVVTIITIPNQENEAGNNITVRGVSDRGVKMRHLAITQGRWFKPGLREIVVGKGIARRYPRAQVGQQLKFARGYWTVVGVMDGGDSAVNSEVFGDAYQIASDFNRTDAYSSALVQATDEISAAALIKRFTDDPRLNVSAMTEREYYDQQTSSAAPISFMGAFVCIIMAVGSSFAAMNTMYAAVARRSKEVGTLRVLGFTKGSILLSFFIESVLLSLVGGLLACLIVLPLNGITTGIGNNITFSETSFNFKVGPQIMLWGLLFSAVLGALGGLLPARQAANQEILTAMRQV